MAEVSLEDLTEYIQHRLDLIQTRRNFDVDLGAAQVQGLPADFREDYQRFDELVRQVRKFGLPVRVGRAVDPGLPVVTRYVYFARVRGTDEWKIGNSAKPQARKKQLETGNSRNLHVRFKVIGTLEQEKILQRYFEKYRIQREFFRGIPDKTIKAAIRLINAQGYGPLESLRA